MDSHRLDSDSMTSLPVLSDTLQCGVCSCDRPLEVVRACAFIAANDPGIGHWARTCRQGSGGGSVRIECTPSEGQTDRVDDLPDAPAPAAAPLTRREDQILQMLVRGCSNKEIATHIFLSEDTVKFHLKNLYSKLGVHRRMAAVIMASRQGLLQAGDFGKA